MGETVRFGVSIKRELLQDFDELIERKNYDNRSEAIRDLIREELIKREWEEEEEVVGVITLLYDHHEPHLSEKLTDLQHHHHDLVLSTTHVHLDRSNCLEVIAVRGRGEDVHDLSSALSSTKGVKHGKLTATSTGKRLE